MKMSADNKTIMGDAYLRRCESTVDAQHRRQVALERSGSTAQLVDGHQCDYDGSYAAVQIIEKIV